MKLRTCTLVYLLITSGFIAPVKAENITAVNEPIPMTQVLPITQEQILYACVQNRAETLPNPYRDVEPTHWAYKAVLSMYYCGAYREATPPSLIQKLLESDSNSQPTQTQ